jgi:hypothetical protein
VAGRIRFRAGLRHLTQKSAFFDQAFFDATVDNAALSAL